MRAVLSSEELPLAAVVAKDPLGLLLVEVGMDEVMAGAAGESSILSISESARMRTVYEFISRVLRGLGREELGVLVVVFAGL